MLVTLRSVDDVQASAFMQRFYYHWLGQVRSDPAAALRAAQREHLDPAQADPTDQAWASFILVGG